MPPFNFPNQVENEISRYHLKFGASFIEAIELLKKCKELQLNIIGLCFHSGYQCRGVSAYAEAIKICFKLFKYAKGELGMGLNVLDIGGGQTTNTIHEIALLVKSALAEHSWAELIPNLNVRAQPGKFFGRTLFTLITQVHSVRVMEPFEPSLKHTFKYYVNAGKFNGLSDFVIYPDLFPIVAVPIAQVTKLKIYNSVSQFITKIFRICNLLRTSIIPKNYLKLKFGVQLWIHQI